MNHNFNQANKSHQQMNEQLMRNYQNTQLKMQEQLKEQKAQEEHKAAAYKMFDQGVFQKFMLGDQLQQLKDATKYDLQKQLNKEELGGLHEESNLA